MRSDVLGSRGATCAAMLGLLLASADAQAPVLVADINAFAITPPSAPTDFAALGGAVYFTALTSATGRELFVTLGIHEAPQTTRLVKDIVPGAGHSSPWYLTPVGGLLFFSADDGSNGRELWKSDGTAAGTVLVKDVRPNGSSFPSKLTAVGSTLFFVADDGNGGVELWKSDGTANGTVLVKDIAAGAATSSPDVLTPLGGTLFLAADDGTHGKELWKSDGTAAGTVMVIDLWSGPGHGYPLSITALGALVLVVADDGVVGQSLWRSDGTPQGTALVKAYQQAPSPQINGVTAVGSAAYFFARTNELWRTDGTPAGTVLVSSGLGWLTQPVAFGQLLMFTATDQTGLSVWRSDGNTAGTFSVATGWPGSGVTQMRAIGARVWFQGNTSSTANQGSLWISDGTVAGTAMLTPIRPGPIGGGPTEFVLAGNGRVVFAADDGLRGREPFVSDGTVAGTKLLADLQTVPARTQTAYARSLTDLFGVTVLVADDGVHGSEPWRTDGTATGTWILRDINPGTATSEATDFARVGSSLYFTANDGATGRELWVTDGTSAGTRIVADLAPGAASSNPSMVVGFKGAVFFTASTGSTSGLWRSDGTAAGTQLLTAKVSVSNVVACEDALLFAGIDQVHGSEPWISDGTSAGTRMIVDLDPTVTARGPVGSNPFDFLRHAGAYWFVGEHSSIGRRDLWRTDGTAAGTTRVDSGSGNPSGLISSGPLVYFVASPLPLGARTLWRSDGSSAGTVPVTARVLDPGQPIGFGNGVLCAATAANLGVELWFSDGTDAGTQVVKDINPGTAGSYPIYLTRTGTRRVWFQATDGARGYEPWVTDGTAAGTSLVADLDPRPVSSSTTGSSRPAFFTLSGARVLFAADDGVHGHEIWSCFRGATAQRIGEGCAPVGPAPSLASDDPVLGITIALSGEQAPSSALGLIALALPGTMPFPTPNGCPFYLDVPTLVTLLAIFPNAASWSVPLTIPNAPQLAGQSVAIQTVFGTIATPVTLSTTNGVRMTLGS